MSRETLRKLYNRRYAQRAVDELELSHKLQKLDFAPDDRPSRGPVDSAVDVPKGMGPDEYQRLLPREIEILRAGIKELEERVGRSEATDKEPLVGIDLSATQKTILQRTIESSIANTLAKLTAIRVVVAKATLHNSSTQTQASTDYVIHQYNAMSQRVVDETALSEKLEELQSLVQERKSRLDDVSTELEILRAQQTAEEDINRYNAQIDECLAYLVEVLDEFIAPYIVDLVYPEAVKLDRSSRKYKIRYGPILVSLRYFVYRLVKARVRAGSRATPVPSSIVSFAAVPAVLAWMHVARFSDSTDSLELYAFGNGEIDDDFLLRLKNALRVPERARKKKGKRMQELDRAFDEEDEDEELSMDVDDSKGDSNPSICEPSSPKTKSGSRPKGQARKNNTKPAQADDVSGSERASSAPKRRARSKPSSNGDDAPRPLATANASVQPKRRRIRRPRLPVELESPAGSDEGENDRDRGYPAATTSNPETADPNHKNAQRDNPRKQKLFNIPNQRASGLMLLAESTLSDAQHVPREEHFERQRILAQMGMEPTISSSAPTSTGTAMTEP